MHMAYAGRRRNRKRRSEVKYGVYITSNGGHWVLPAEKVKSESFYCCFCAPTVVSCISTSRFSHLGSSVIPLSVF